MGSVKDIKIIEEAKEKPGIAEFIFSDRYSVFDWGEMPDVIENKGASLCLVGSYFFEKMNRVGIKNHYIGVVENGEAKSIDKIEKPSNSMRVKLLRVLKPKIVNAGYDYSIYSKEKSNFLIPFEVIYRNFLPEGSSIIKRYREGKIKPEDFGLKKFEINQELDTPIFEFSTKLEEVDRYVRIEEVKRIIREEEIEEILEIAEKINEIKRQREVLLEKLSEIEGLKVYPSKANFILVRIVKRGVRAGDVQRSLMMRGILVRDRSNLPLLDNCLRITVCPSYMIERLTSALKEALGS